MTSARTIALLAAALLVLAVAGCTTGERTGTTSTSGAHQASTTSQAVNTTAATERATTTTPPTSDDGLAEEYAVYSALIQGMFIASDAPPALIVIEGMTANPDFGMFSARDAVNTLRGQWPDLGDDILGDLLARNAKQSVLERRFSLSVEYVFVSKEQIDAIFSNHASGWDDFYAKYPHSQGILTLSRVGFNAAVDTAVLYTGNQYHYTGGEGHVVLMKKVEGRWTVRGEAMTWIS
jgi:hypothetical protein